MLNRIFGRFSEGPLTRPDAARLNEMADWVERLLNLTASGPLQYQVGEGGIFLSHGDAGLGVTNGDGLTQYRPVNTLVTNRMPLRGNDTDATIEPGVWVRISAVSQTSPPSYSAVEEVENGQGGWSDLTGGRAFNANVYAPDGGAYGVNDIVWVVPDADQQTWNIVGPSPGAVFVQVLGGDTPLVADMTATQTFLIGKNGAPFPVSAGYFVLIDSELVEIASFASIGFNLQTSCTRGMLGTTAAAHSAGAVIRAATYTTAQLNSNDKTISFSAAGLIPVETRGNVLPSAVPYVLYLGNQNAQTGEPIIVTGGTGTSGVYTCERLGFGSYPPNTPLTMWVPYTGNTCYGIFGPGGMRQGSVTEWNLVQNEWQNFQTVFVEPPQSTCDPFYRALVPGLNYDCEPSANLGGVVPIIGMPLYQTSSDAVSLGAQQYGGLYNLAGASLQQHEVALFPILTVGNSPASYVTNVNKFGWPGDPPLTNVPGFGLTLPIPNPSYNAGMPGWLMTVTVYFSNYGVLTPGGNNQAAGQFIEVDVFQVPQAPGGGTPTLTYFPPIYAFNSQPLPLWTNPPYTAPGVLGATVPTWTLTFQTICQPGTYAIGVRTSWSNLPGSFNGTVSVMPFPFSELSVN